MTSILPPGDQDWPSVLAVANLSAPAKADANPSWLDNRRAFQGNGAQLVARDDSGVIIGFGAIEETQTGSYRVFVVTSIDDLKSTGLELWEYLASELDRRGAMRVWAREERQDVELLRFFEGLQFVAAPVTRHDSGIDVVLLERSWRRLA